jgi:hypothetical protein
MKEILVFPIKFFKYFPTKSRIKLLTEIYSVFFTPNQQAGRNIGVDSAYYKTVKFMFGIFL